MKLAGDPNDKNKIMVSSPWSNCEDIMADLKRDRPEGTARSLSN
jgi:hypothetical protein